MTSPLAARSRPRPRARDDVVFRQLDDEWVIFDPAAERLHALNLTAALVWSHLTGEWSVREVAERVAQAFEPAVATERALPDVEAAVARFRAERLLQ